MKIKQVDINRILKRELTDSQLACMVDMLDIIQTNESLDLNLKEAMSKHYQATTIFITRLLVLIGVMAFNRKGRVSHIQLLNRRLLNGLMNDEITHLDEINLEPFLNIVSVSKKEVMVAIDEIFTGDKLNLACTNFCEEHFVAPFVLREALIYLQIAGVLDYDITRSRKMTIYKTDNTLWDYVIKLTRTSLGVTV